MKNLAKRILRAMCLDGFAIRLKDNFVSTYREISRRFKRKGGRLDSAIIRDYFAGPGVKKLHLGCDINVLPGWLNADIDPPLESILCLDATKTFPFPDGTFDYIYSAHMIEHVPYPAGLAMLRECHRVLKKNGKIRISTPDLQFLIDLHTDRKSDLQNEYVKWATDSFIKSATHYDDVFVINNYVRNWGHTFIYDEGTMSRSLQSAGFTSVAVCDLNQSQDPELRNLENESAMPEGFLKLESLTLEGTKAAD
jgi:predicted SAM-dependent methyltransferase